MRRPIDEISDFIIMELVKDKAQDGINVSSIINRDDIINVIDKFLFWAKKNNKFITPTSIDITDLL